MASNPKPFTFEPDFLVRFIKHSNHIEGIAKHPDMDDLEIYQNFLDLKDISLTDVSRFMAHQQPGAILRDLPGLDVHVGKYVAPNGGPRIRQHLELLLTRVVGRWEDDDQSAYDLHREYEGLHPYTDGNGRSGRLLWLWMKIHRERDERIKYIPFLQLWYYDSLPH